MSLMLGSLMPHNETENQNYTFHASAFGFFFCQRTALVVFNSIRKLMQQHTNDAAISYTNLNLQLLTYNKTGFGYKTITLFALMSISSVKANAQSNQYHCICIYPDLK